MKEIELTQVLHHLDTDMGDLLGLFERPNVYEVMLNPYKREDGQFEGHIWFEEAGVGMTRLIKTKEVILPKFTSPKVGDTVVYRYVDFEGKRNILNFSVLPTEQEQLLQCISFVLINTLKQDDDGLDYVEQEEHFKLNVLATNIKNGVLVYREPFSESELSNPANLVQLINLKLASLIGLDFRLGVGIIENEDELVQFACSPSKLISKEFVKMTATKALQIMGILAAANSLNFHDKIPRLECAIPYYHHRFTGQRSPIVKFPSFTIRKHASKIITIDQYVESGMMPAHCAATIKGWIKDGKNILVCGGTGSGKTTLLNALIYELARISPQFRAVIIEDTPEIQCELENAVPFCKSNEVTIDDLLVTSLRMRPDSIMVGELRSKEAYTLFKAMLTGHKNCFGTIHATGAIEATFRFEQCIKEHPDAAGSIVPRAQIAMALDAVISIQKTTVRVNKPDGSYENQVRRKLTALREIRGYDSKFDIYEDIMLYQDKEAIIEADPKSMDEFLWMKNGSIEKGEELDA